MSDQKVESGRIADGAGEGKVIDEGVKNPFNDLYRFRGVVPQAYIFKVIR